MRTRGGDVPWDVVEDLQARLLSLEPGSEEEAVAEHAIDLALNRRGVKPTSFHLHDVLRNAKYSYRRSRARFDAAVERASVGAARYSESPESACCARDLLSAVAVAANRAGPHGRLCLEGLIHGERISETAKAAAVSSRSVERARGLIRATARSWMDTSL